MLFGVLFLCFGVISFVVFVFRWFLFLFVGVSSFAIGVFCCFVFVVFFGVCFALWLLMLSGGCYWFCCFSMVLFGCWWFCFVLIGSLAHASA